MELIQKYDITERRNNPLLEHQYLHFIQAMTGYIKREIEKTDQNTEDFIFYLLNQLRYLLTNYKNDQKIVIMNTRCHFYLILCV